MAKKAVILLSGGLDSTTLLHLLKSQYDLYPICFLYNQRNSIEVSFAKKTSTKYLGKKLLVYKLNSFPWLKTSSLLNSNLKLTNFKSKKSLPNTFVPGRNTLFFSLAFSYAYSIKAQLVFSGVDFSYYPDCQPEFISSLSKSLSLGLNYSINLHAPFIFNKKFEIKEMADRLFNWRKETWSCYNPVLKNGKSFPCLKCDPCKSRL